MITEQEITALTEMQLQTEKCLNLYSNYLNASRKAQILKEPKYSNEALTVEAEYHREMNRLNEKIMVWRNNQH